jgi:type I pantothenate kinase
VSASSAIGIDSVAEAVRPYRPPQGTFIVGITGSVASGKSSLAAALAQAFAADAPVVEQITTDGFLFPNQVLGERGLDLVKGFPETYDLAALAAALTGARRGAVSVPAYSHVTYDVDPAAARRIERPGVLIVEGLGLGHDRPLAPGAAALVDCLVYVDAAEADLETWFVIRFMRLWDAAANDPASFYARFRGLDRAGAQALAHQVWSGINLPNLRNHIAPLRAVADVVVTKAADHTIASVVSVRA